MIQNMSSHWYPAGQPTFNVAMPPLDRLLDTPPSNSREMRNRAEKARRDKLNTHISELAALVPMVAGSARRVDKTTILRLAASYLRMYHVLKPELRSFSAAAIPSHSVSDHAHAASRHQNNESQNDRFYKDDDIPADTLFQMVSDQLGGFFLVVAANGKIVFVSHVVENMLGHSQTDLMGQSVYNITCPDDHERLRRQLSQEPSPDMLVDVNDDSDGAVTNGEWRRNFNLRLARAGPRCEPPTYELVNVLGVLKPSGCLTCVVRLCKPAPLAERLLEATKNEYVTRHLVDGRIISCDQRISVVAGYLSEEVAGLSAFNFMHREDVRWTMIGLRQMYDRGESRGSSCYRLLARTGQFVYLRTCGYLEIDSTGAVESFLCVNTLVSEEEGQRLIRDMKRRYSALVQTSDTALPLPDTHSVGEPAVEDPQQLEEAILHLVHNLPGSPGSPKHEIQDCIDYGCNAPAPKRARVTPTVLPLGGKYKRARSAHSAATLALDRQIRKHRDSLIQFHHRRDVAVSQTDDQPPL